MPIVRIDAYLFDQRQGHGGKVTLPPTLLTGLDRLLADAQVLHPTYTYEALLRYVWVKGLDAFRVAIEAKKLLGPNQLPKSVRKA